MLGLMLIFVGFFGFMMGCVIYSPEGYTTIFGSPTNLSAFVFNMLMGLAGGLHRRLHDLAGRAVLDGLRRPGRRHRRRGGHRPLPPADGVRHRDRRRRDDPVRRQAPGAIQDRRRGRRRRRPRRCVGIWSLLACGIFLVRATRAASAARRSRSSGRSGRSRVFAALGFVPGYLCAGALKLAGLLRSPPEVEILGLDLSEIPAAPYPEGIPATARIAALRSPERRRRGARRHLQRTGGMTT